MAWSIAGLHGLADNVALKVREIEALAVTLESDRVAQVARVQALADPDWEGGLLESLTTETAEITALRNKVKAFVKAVGDQSLKAVGMSLSEWYGENRTGAQRLPPEFAELVRANNGEIDPRYVWPPFETNMAEAEAPGAVANQDLSIAPIDSKQYAGGGLKLHVLVKVETSVAQPLGVVVDGIQYNGDPWQGSASIPKDSVPGFEVAVTPAIAGTFCLAVTGMVCTVAGGAWTAGKFSVLTVDDRTPAP